MINISNDDSNVSNPNTVGLQKILPVQKSSAIQNPPQNGNVLPVKAATSEQNIKPQQVIDSEALDKVVQDINEKMQTVQRELHFSIDKDSGRTVIKVIDMETKKVIRQIPNEEALNFARRLDEGSELELFSGYI